MGCIFKCKKQGAQQLHNFLYKKRGKINIYLNIKNICVCSINRLLEQNRESRNRLMHVRKLDFTKYGLAGHWGKNTIEILLGQMNL